MHLFLLLYGFVFLFKEIASEIILTGPEFVHKNQVIKFNCSSTSVPDRTAAEFLMNGGTLTNIRSQNNICFNSVNGGNCEPELCQCSEDTKSFVFYYDVQSNYNGHDENTFSCKMNLNGKQEISNIVTVIILDSPDLLVKDREYCNSSESVILKCKVTGGTQNFGFAEWQHSLHGKFIRSIKGFNENKLSLLVIPSCNYHDEGDYSCRVWNSFDDGLLWTNGTTTLFVRESPRILKKSCISMHSTNVLCEAVVFSSSNVLSVVWYKDKEDLQNSTGYQQSITSEHVLLNIYGTMIAMKGVRVQIISKDHVFLGQNITLCVQNIYSWTCDNFMYAKDLASNTGLISLWMVFCIVFVALVTISFTLIVYLVRSIVSLKATIKTMMTSKPNHNSIYDEIDSSDAPMDQSVHVSPCQGNVDLSKPIKDETVDDYLEVVAESDEVNEQSEQCDMYLQPP